MLSPRNFNSLLSAGRWLEKPHCVEFVKFNAMEITLTFLVIFTSFLKFEIFNVLNVMFLRSVFVSICQYFSVFVSTW